MPLTTGIALPQISHVFEKTLLVAVVTDLAIGGNGYLIEIGSWRIREILFALCVPWAILRLTIVRPVKLDRKLIALTIAFVLITAFDAALGYIRGNNPTDIIAEIKPLSYFPMVLFFAVAIASRAEAALVAKIFVVCGIILSVAYLLLLLAAYLHLVSYLDIYNRLGESDEFIFRQAVDRQQFFVGFLYKGMFDVNIAVLFLMFGPFRYGQWIALICTLALAMTLTRSMFVGLTCSVLFGLLLARSLRLSIVALGQLGMMAVIILVAVRVETSHNMKEFAALGAQPEAAIAASPYASHPAPPASPRESAPPATAPPATAPPAAGAQAAPEPAPPTAAIIEARPTDTMRTNDIRFVFDHLNLKSILIGNGLGTWIGARNRIELNFLEVFYKQGLVGLLFWGLLAGYVFWLYRLAARQARELALPFLLSAIFVYATTTFNTFLTGSIGMGVVFISIGALSALARDCK